MSYSIRTLICTIWGLVAGKLSDWYCIIPFLAYSEKKEQLTILKEKQNLMHNQVMY